MRQPVFLALARETMLRGMIHWGFSMNHRVDSAKAPPAAIAAEVAAARAEFDKLLKDNKKTSFVDAVMADICGVLRGKRMPVSEADKLFQSGMQIPLSIYLMDAKGEMANPFGRGFGDGDPDGTAWPAPGTATRVWGSEPARAQIFMAFRDSAGGSFAGNQIGRASCRERVYVLV